MVLINAGKFAMGTDDAMPFEGPVHAVEVSSYLIDQREVTVAEFAKFIEATGYQTEAERFGWSGVFVVKDRGWQKVDGANWRNSDYENASSCDPSRGGSWTGRSCVRTAETTRGQLGQRLKFAIGQ